MLPATRQIAIRDLPPDSLLSFDLVTPDGLTILRKGQFLEKGMVDRWLSLGFDMVLAADESPLQLVRPLDTSVIQETAACTDTAVQRLGELVATMAAGVSSGLSELSSVLAMIAEVTLADRDAAVWSIEKEIQTAETADLRLAKRSSKLSVMSYVTARALGHSPEECQSVAMAALLHDVALYSQSMEIIKNSHPRGITTKHILQRHSLLGAELVTSIADIHSLTQQAMLEVHEQVNGSGYPRGLRNDRLSPGGKLLNLIDAYLSLTDTTTPTALIPADAIAYMMKQTSDGLFDTQCMQAFLRIVSAYGIGTQVTLDDESHGEVIRSSETDALRPIIRLDDQHHTVVDLRHSSLAIKEARRAQGDPRKRIKRSAMADVLWQPAYFAD